jgi:hypothetical protein
MSAVAVVEEKTRVMITPNVKDATVTLDGTVYTETPVIEDVKPGKHTVKTSAKGYFDDEREVVGVKGSLVALEVGLKERPAYLALGASRGAEISVDGRPVGTAPLSFAVELPVGPHTVLVSMTGHEPVLKTVTLERGVVTPLVIRPKETGQRVASRYVLTAGGLALVGGAVLTGLALNKESAARSIHNEAAAGTIGQSRLDQYNTDLDNRDAYKRDAIILYGASAALFLTGGAMYLFDHPSLARSESSVGENARPHAVSFIPRVEMPRGGGLTGVLSGSF